MKLHIVSDLHLDANSEPFRVPHVDCDAVVIAGDICEGPVKAVQWIARQKIMAPVIYVPGNHEYYGTDKDQALHDARIEASRQRALGVRIELLHEDFARVIGRNGELALFVGATLWTDYALDGEAWRTPAMLAARTMMNDHRAIRTKDGKGFWTPADAAAEHNNSRQYIDCFMRAKWPGGPKIVVTHHAPSARSVHPRYHGSVLNSAYASDLEHLVDQADLWIHGHVHHRQDYRIGDGRVVCNPRGYGHEDSGFDPGLVVAVERVREEA